MSKTSKMGRPAPNCKRHTVYDEDCIDCQDLMRRRRERELAPARVVLQSRLTEPNLEREHFSRAGKIGGPRGPRSNKVRAGHARAASLYRGLAAKAMERGYWAQADDYERKAETQEKLAKKPTTP